MRRFVIAALILVWLPASLWGRSPGDGGQPQEPAALPATPAAGPDSPPGPGPVASPGKAATDPSSPRNLPMNHGQDKTELRSLIVAGGCFWCVEAVFEELQGVHDVVSGYIGGTVDRPNYEQVCSGETGHAEACRITYDPALISYEKLLEIFFRTHDPTTLNRQGNDWGTQYRSAIFVQSEEERQVCARILTALNEAEAFSAPVVTTLEPAGTFYPAEDYHQDYFRKNPTNAYCRSVIPPKLKKLKKAFGEQLKSDETP